MNPKILANVLEERVREEGMSSVDTFVQFLQARSALHLLPSVLSELKRRKVALSDGNRLMLTTSHDVSDKLVAEVQQWVDTSAGTTVSVKVDPTLIGGFRAVYKNKLYDASLKTKLHQLRQRLLHSL